MAKIPEGSALHTCIVPDDLWAAAKERTRADGTSMTAIILSALAAYSGLPEPQPGRRGPGPRSKADPGRCG